MYTSNRIWGAHVTGSRDCRRGLPRKRVGAAEASNPRCECAHKDPCPYINTYFFMSSHVLTRVYMYIYIVDNTFGLFRASATLVPE